MDIQAKISELKSIRICYVANRAEPKPGTLSGANRSLLNLIHAESQEGFNNFIVVSHGKCGLLDIMHEDGVQTAVVKGAGPMRNKKFSSLLEAVKNFLKWPYILLHVGKAKQLLKEEKISIVHINDDTCNIAFAYAALKLGIPYIWHIRNFGEEDLNISFAWKKETLRLMKSANEVIAITNAVRQKWEPLLKRTMRVVYNGLPASSYFEIRNDILRTQQIRILLIGAIVEGKGQMDAIKAIEKLVDSGYTNYRLTIVGCCNACRYEKNVLEYVDKHGLKRYVEFVDYTCELKKIRRMHDVGLLCSRSEAFGRVTVENMLAGLLMIGTNSGGTPELITNGKTGFLYEAGDVRELKAILLKVDSERQMMRQIAKCGQEYAKNNFSIERTAKNMINLYYDLVK